ncbi:hypothetical protein [Odoribacter splanchnicus]
MHHSGRIHRKLRHLLRSDSGKSGKKIIWELYTILQYPFTNQLIKIKVLI